MDRFLRMFDRFVEFSYAVWDRIVLRGDYERLPRPENIVYFFRDVMGVPCITPKVLAERTERYRKWVAGYARKQGAGSVTGAHGNFMLGGGAVTGYPRPTTRSPSLDMTWENSAPTALSNASVIPTAIA